MCTHVRRVIRGQAKRKRVPVLVLVRRAAVLKAHANRRQKLLANPALDAEGCNLQHLLRCARAIWERTRSKVARAARALGGADVHGERRERGVPFENGLVSTNVHAVLEEAHSPGCGERDADARVASLARVLPHNVVIVAELARRTGLPSQNANRRPDKNFVARGCQPLPRFVQGVQSRIAAAARAVPRERILGPERRRRQRSRCAQAACHDFATRTARECQRALLFDDAL